jgi:hydrogenase nickel incorporation protein HypA/HybF
MHEFSTAKGIVDTILTVAQENNAKKITEVNLEIGLLTMLNDEQLRFSFQILTEHTIAKDARFNITYSSMKMTCNSCGFQRELSKKDLDNPLNVIPVLKCLRCDNNDVKIDEGRSCNIRKIRIEKEV